MDKLKALVLMICITISAYVVFDLVMDNRNLMKENRFLKTEKEVYETAYINQLNKETVHEYRNVYEYAEEIYSVEAELLEAIERLETGNYTSDLFASKNNTWGAFDGVEHISFDNHKQSTVELARTLKFNYIDEGLETIEEIATKYCPTDVNWAIKVKQIYAEIKGE